MALVGNDLYVATTDAVLRFPYEAGDTQITVPGSKVVTLPAGPINHHWTKNLIASVDGSKLYVTVGSNSNVAERGMAVEAERAAIWEVDIRNDAHRISERAEPPSVSLSRDAGQTTSSRPSVPCRRPGGEQSHPVT
ncbi:hypothetical protein O4G98_08600 [Zoogloeaceae bacterium G21618-S1]|nr:hypothetical protein [Zoogloeaceae bacterium G21618-S1]